jgi:ribosomal-protein-alanine N-acetyltransferase
VSEAIVERLRDAGDLDGVLEIEALSFNNPTTREWYERELQRADVCFIYVLRLPESSVAGFCAFWRIASEMHINNLAIRPELRGRGSNVAARRLYACAGFDEAGVRRNYYTQPVEDALVLTRGSL